jgi:hypothetical protein
MNKTLRFTALIIMLIISLLVLLVMAAMIFVHSKHINLTLFLSEYKLAINIWRYCLMGLFVFYYPKIILYLYAKRGDININKLSRRRYAIMICLFYELIIVHNLFGYLLNYIIHRI